MQARSIKVRSTSLDELERVHAAMRAARLGHFNRQETVSNLIDDYVASLWKRYAKQIGGRR